MYFAKIAKGLRLGYYRGAVSGSWDTSRDEALPLGPVPGLDLRLPIVKDRCAVGVSGVVSRADCLGVIAFRAAIKACDPSADKANRHRTS